jgi:hypothetical protein
VSHCIREALLRNAKTMDELLEVGYPPLNILSVLFWQPTAR